MLGYKVKELRRNPTIQDMAKRKGLSWPPSFKKTVVLIKMRY